MTTEPLAGFLLARIAEDEAEASALAERYSDCRDETGWYRNDDEVVVFVGVGRALTECEAKRWIVGQLKMWEGWSESDPARRPALNMLRPVAHALAAVYADHPDYDEEWKP